MSKEKKNIEGTNGQAVSNGQNGETLISLKGMYQDYFLDYGKCVGKIDKHNWLDEGCFSFEYGNKR